MKLVELLARELDVWPEVDGVEPTYIVQEGDTSLYSTTIKPVFGVGRVWYRGPTDDEGECGYFGHTGVALADDHATAIITRAEWQAERARIAKPAEAKWIRHRGGKCPVEAGVLVEVRMRYGGIGKDLAGGLRWNHCAEGGDIMAFRICEPAKMPEPLSVDELQAAIGQPDGPLEWRDRIHTIDFDIAAQNEAHRLAIETLEEERVELVQRLAGEGLQLVGATAVPAEDMSDWRNWKDGDLVECVSTEGAYPAELTLGNTYEIRDGGAIDDEGDNMAYCVKHGNCFKWHSRPTA